VRTLVISDLHLGARSQVDVLRRPAALDALLAGIDGVDRLVILGDALELRYGPIHEAAEVARPILRAVGERLGPEGQVVLVPGNHDHRLVGPWLDWRARSGPTPLGLEEHAGPKATTATRAVARMLAPAALDVVYPGIWLGDGVYATHGHYLDRHNTVPSFERLGAGILERLLRAPAAARAVPDDYELVLAPMYALLDAIAARATDGRAAAPGNAGARAWTALTRDGRDWRRRALATAFPLGVGAINRAGIGPVKADLSGPELRRAALRAMREVVARLGIDARHVVFGHTHRAGPLPGDDPDEWTLPGGGALMNAGSWVYEHMYVGRSWGDPYWPGAAVALEDGDGPRLLRLLQRVDGAAISPPAAPAPA
jgi:calcineurin-like phosphoesterase family protein